MRPRDLRSYLADLSGRYEDAYAAAIGDLLVSISMNDALGRERARSRLAEVTRDTLGISELVASLKVIQRAARVNSKRSLAAAKQSRALAHFSELPVETVVPRVSFDEAVQEILERTPTTIRDSAERTADAIASLYSEERVVAFVNAAETSVTEKAQQIIANAIEQGIPEASYVPEPGAPVLPGAGRLLTMGVDEVREESAAWTDSYSRMAFRTNLNTAATAGRFRTAQDPVVQAAIPAFQFSTSGDGDVRPNHAAGDGLIFRVDNPVWFEKSPPLDYNCRCDVIEMDVFELENLGRMDPKGNVIEDRDRRDWFASPKFRKGPRADILLSPRGALA